MKLIILEGQVSLRHVNIHLFFPLKARDQLRFLWASVQIN